MQIVDNAAELNFVKIIFKAQARGENVKDTCFKIAGEDELKAIRLQNKFKALLKNKKEIVEEAITLLKSENIIIENPYNERKPKNNIIDLPPPERISEMEINSLFMGLCKLVKKLALEDANFEWTKKINKIESSLKSEIENLKMINIGLAQELKKYQIK